MLLVVINHKAAHHQESREDAGGHPHDHGQGPRSSRQGGDQQKQGRQNAPPTLPRVILRKSLNSSYQL
jgi:hypothetical protein